ncbi:MAG: hypothetical protein LBK26_00445 [Rickettsiales bacterium]|jgi:predicted phage terminase large subunit-like protein|nr:hypothetical protein [Rickettsiales bacterium]
MPNEQPFLKGFRMMRIPIVNDKGASAWPEVFPIEKIDRLRETAGPRYFSSQMMLEFISEDRARLDPGALRFYDGEFNPQMAHIDASMHGNAPLQITGIAAYWDPSSAKDGADSSVCAIIFRDDKNRRAFIHDIKYLATGADDLHPFATQCGRVLDFLGQYGQRNIAIEVNGIGNALPEILRGAAIAKGRPIAIQKIINRENKEKRILDAIEPLLATGRLYAHERVRRTRLIAEMEEWLPVAGANHDDGLDAVAGALRMTPIAIRPRGQMFLPLRAATDFKV